jgi:nucleoid-associated protein YgaU
MVRRIATNLTAVLVLTVALTGCQKKKATEYEVQNLGTDSYASTSGSEPTTGYNTYPVQSTTSYPSEPSTYPAQGAGSYDSYDAGAGGSRYHTVAKGDTLYRLARMYYNDQGRWKDIYEQNRSQIGDPNRIRVGQRLVIP